MRNSPKLFLLLPLLVAFFLFLISPSRALAQYPYCGDFYCSSSIGEDCNSCAEDCGICATPTPTPFVGCFTNGTSCSSSGQCCSAYCSGVCGDAPTPTPTIGGPTPTFTPTPTQAPNRYPISGVVFYDANSNGAQDPGETGYPGAVLTLSGGAQRASGFDGSYNFANLLAGTYSVTLSVPSDHVLTTVNNPIILTIPIGGGGGIANFGINYIPPTCTSMSANPSTVVSGAASTVTVSGCSPAPAYTWPAPQTVPAGSSAGSNSDGAAASTTYTAPANICSTTTVRQGVTVSNSGGSNSYTTDLTVTPLNTLSGTVYLDTGGNNCASGATPYTGGATVSVYSGGAQTATANSNGSGVYAVRDQTTCGSKTAVISGIGAYHLRRVNPDSAGWTTSNMSGFTYGPFNFSADHTLDYCISDKIAWLQLPVCGDIRTPSLIDSMPAGQNLCADGSNPGVCFSSSFPASFGSGACSTQGWVVNDEYSYDDAKSTNGVFSYSFFLSRARVKSLTIQDLPNCAAGGDCAISNLQTGIYKANGSLNITSYTHRAGTHVTILANGDLTIKSKINTVPTGAGNLLILAAKRDILVDPAVGENSAASTTDDIQAMLTAERNIVVQGNKCVDGVTSDFRLNIGGNLVANSLKPLAINGSGGKVDNQRSLCVNDDSYPSLAVSYRPDFIAQLTDFYKVPLTRWREVAP